MATSRYIKVKEKQENKWLIPLLVCLFTGFGVVFATGGFAYGRFVTVIILGVGMILDIDDTFCLLCFCLPFTSMLKFSQDSSSILAFIYIIIIFKLMSREKMEVPPMSFFSLLLLASLQTFTIFFYNSIITEVFSILLNIVFVLFISTYFSFERKDNSRLLITASFCLSISCTLMLLLNDLFPQMPYLAHAARTAQMVAANRYAATVLDPNELSQLILIALGLLVATIPSIKTTTGKIAGVAIFIYMAITGLRTNSKSYVLSVLALFIFLLYTYLRIIVKKKGINSALMRLVPLLIVAVIGCVLIVNYVVLPIFEARSQEQTDFFTNRTSIWTNYIGALLRSPDVLLIGAGANNVTGIFRLLGYEYSTVPHNFYLEYLIQFGFGGLATLFLTWKGLFAVIKKKLNTYFIIPLAAFLITGFGISVNDSDCLFILLALLSIPLPAELNQQIITTNKNKPSSVRRSL